MDLTGIERVIAQLTATIYDDMQANDAVPVGLNDARMMQDVIQAASIGQLLTMSNLGGRWKGFRILGKDGDMISVYISGCYGGMMLDGSIHT